jgi:wyosine [tRNA(Phe)-imidazoG37] synthetase (radical SAM superfamily)
MFLHQSTIYGPLHSRRLGNSLGINLLPSKRKVCNFDCIYCECGWTDKNSKDALPSVEEFQIDLEKKLDLMHRNHAALNYITFAGNGEPTLHPHFEKIIAITIALRDRYFPESRIAVLSNATRILEENIFNALQKIDDPILKLDAGTERMFQLIDLPASGISLAKVVGDLKKFNGKLTIQTIFLRGQYQKDFIDNTSASEVTAWLNHLLEIKPKLVMLYSIDRQTPVKGLEKISKKELEGIASKVRQAGIAAESFA